MLHFSKLELVACLSMLSSMLIPGLNWALEWTGLVETEYERIWRREEVNCEERVEGNRRGKERKLNYREGEGPTSSLGLGGKLQHSSTNYPLH